MTDSSDLALDSGKTLKSQRPNEGKQKQEQKASTASVHTGNDVPRSLRPSSQLRFGERQTLGTLRNVLSGEQVVDVRAQM